MIIDLIQRSLAAARIALAEARTEGAVDCARAVISALESLLSSPEAAR